MSQSTKPTTNINTFVPEYWRESGGLDIGYANSHYLRFPVGQGTETFTNLLVSGTSTLGTTSTSSITSSGNITAPNFVGNITLASTSVINRQVNFPNNTTSLAKESIDYPLNSTSTIRASNVIANLPVGSSSQYQNTFTFGKSIPPISLLGGEGTNTISYSIDNGQSWVGLGTSVFSLRCRCFVWNGSIWVAGGNGGGTNSIAWSNDSVVWNSVSTGIISEVYNIVWDNQKFVAVGEPSPTTTIMYSYDGKNWVGISFSWFSTVGLGIAWNGNIYVAGGIGATHTLATSPDGITWTGRGNATFPTECYDVAWNGILFVGVGSSQLAYSYDGVVWNGLVSPLSDARVIEWNGLMFVAGGAGGSQLAYSYNGITWVNNTINNLVGDVYGLGWNGTVWILSGSGANRTAISYNGVDWIALGLGGIFSINAYNASSNRMREHTITFPTNRTVIGGDGTNTIAYSDDEGATWTGLGIYIFSTGRAFATNGSVWVGGGSGSNTLGWSYDGVAWNGLGTTIFTTNCYNILWTGSLFFAVGQGGSNLIATSPNGSAWTGYGIPSPFATAIFDIAYNGSLYVACGAGGTIGYSTTGTSGWTAVSPALFDTDALAVEWNGSLFVAVGQGSVNTIAHSFDGITWVGQGRTIFTTAGRTVAWNGSVWVVGGISGGAVVAYSKTGLSWTLGTGTTPLIRFNSIGWNGTRFIGVGQGGQSISSSPDGANWTSYTSPVFTSAGHSFGSNINKSAVSIKQNILILGRQGTNDVMYYSLDDGVSWTAMKTTTMTTNCSGLSFNGYVWVAGGIGNNTLSYSYNGQNWIGIGGALNDNGRGIGWNGSRFVAVGSHSTTRNVAYTNNVEGVWTILNVNSGSLGWRCVAGNSSGTWVIGGQGTNSMAYSIDNGSTWTTLVGGGALPTWAMGIIWTGTKFIVVALGGSMVYTSTNGSTWSAITNISGFTFGVCIATNGNIVVAGGVGSSTLAYSRDQGATWTAVINSGSVFQAITSITWTGTRFVACGNRISGGTTGIYSSIDGITWSAPTATTFANTDSVISSGIGITQDNSFQLKYPDTILDVVAPNYINQGYSNCSVSISSL